MFPTLNVVSVTQARVPRLRSAAMPEPSRHARVAVVCGGPAAEREVSLASGREVAAALRASFDDVTVHEPGLQLAVELMGGSIDVVFPALHGPLGEDGSIQGMLEVAGVPYVGSGVAASACAMDKVLAKRLFRDAGLPLAREVVIERHEAAGAAARVRAALPGRVAVKPATQGSALGVAFAETGDQLEAALDDAFRFDEKVLVEEFVVGSEITVGILEAPEPQPFPVIDIRTPGDSWYDFEHRYAAGLSEHVIPAPLPPDVYASVQELAVHAHVTLGCRDLSRVDFVVEPGGRIVLLEVNTLPGMTPTSLYPDGAQAAGISFEQLVEQLVRRALSRAPARDEARTAPPAA
jgi:D-alanine-D-alanine ligase